MSLNFLVSATVEKKQAGIILFIALVITFLSRLLFLDQQSLWLDELHTMNEADPDLTYWEMFNYLSCCDQHPPLHFFVSKAMFSLFGHIAFVARIPSVIAGTVSVWAMYLLGKEFLDRRLGLIAAILTSVNYFHLQYSQEARNYIFLFLFTILSFLYFIRLIKSMSIRNAIRYVIFTLLMVYSHYFGLFVLVSQVVLIGIFFFLEERANRKRFFLLSLFSGALIFIGYLPWIPFLQAMSNIKSFWIRKVPPTFFIDYCLDYFGNSVIVKIPVLLLFLFFTVKLFYGKKIHLRSLQKRPQAFAMTVLFIWFFGSLAIPYIRSILVIPMLVSRYTIIVLPTVLIALSYGIRFFPTGEWQTCILWGLVLICIIEIVWIQGYYTSVHKSQFREMTAFVVANNKKNYPIINERTHWQQQYFFKLSKVQPTILSGTKVAVVDSILHKVAPKYDLEGFWIVGAQGDSPLTPQQRQALDLSYKLVREKQWYDAWAQFYERKK